MGHAVVGHLGHVDLVGDGLEAVVLVELNLVIDHPGADLLVAAPLRTPAEHLLLEEALDLLSGVGVPEVEVGLGLLPLYDGVLLPGGEEGSRRGPGEATHLRRGQTLVIGSDQKEEGGDRVLERISMFYVFREKRLRNGCGQ